MLLVAGFAARAEIVVRDDAGEQIRVPGPAHRIVSLAPHVTELLYAAGAGEKIVGAVEYSDYPPAARLLPSVGSGVNIDIERILALAPDLIVGWQSGNSAAAIARLRALGLSVYLTEPRRLEDIAHDIMRLGLLAGTGDLARAASENFLSGYAQLRARHAGKRQRSVFYQVLDPSLLTVSREHLITEVLRLCGGENALGSIGHLAGRVEIEAVLAANPELIIAAGPLFLWEQWRARWQRFATLRAVHDGRLYRVDADLLHRHTPRILKGAAQVCAALDDAGAGTSAALPAPTLR